MADYRSKKSELPEVIYELVLEEYIRIQELKEQVHRRLALSLTPEAWKTSEFRTAILKDTRREIEIAFENLGIDGEKGFYEKILRISRTKPIWGFRYEEPLEKMVAPLVECNLTLDLNLEDIRV